MIDEGILLRLRVEDLLFQEADLLDAWRLEEWLTLYTDDAHYYVPPNDVDGERADPDTDLFYIVDDRLRMEQRVLRLAKQGAHSEQPHSKVRRIVGNVRAWREGERIHARSSFFVSRAKDASADIYVGHALHEIVEDGGALRIAKKTCILDMEALRPHARISIIL